MGVTLLTRQSAPEFLKRLGAIQPDTPRQWGTLTPAALMAHLRRTFEICLGEHPVKDISNPLTRTVVRWLFIHVLPWPKGKIKAPAEWTPAPEGDFEIEKQKLLEIIERFLDTAEREPLRCGRSPLFGNLSLEYWRRIHGKHLDHHLRQFGV